MLARRCGFVCSIIRKWRIGRVVRVHPIDSQEGMLGVGIHIERFDTKVQAQERWTS